MLSYFRAENYKCLERVEFPLTPIHVLIGPNDSGKTSVLEAMRAYMQSTYFSIPVRQALPEGWEGKELVYHGIKIDGPVPFGPPIPGAPWVVRQHSAEIDLKVSLTAMSTRSLAPADAVAGIGPPWHLLGHGFSLSFPPNGQCLVTDEWKVARREVDGPQTSGDPIESKQPLSRADVGLEFTTPAFRKSQGVNGEEQLKLPRGMFGSASLYRFDPKTLAVPAMANPDRKFRMDPDGFGLATLLDDILGYDPELFLALRKAFCDFFPQFKSVRLETATAYHRDYAQQGVHALRASGTGKEILFETQWGGVVRARQASEGVLLFLAFLALVHLPPPNRPKLVLFEEPERGVYPKKLEELIRSLKKWVESNGENTPQIVISTHSPYLISFFGPEEVTFLARTMGGGVRARPLRNAPNIHERLSGGFYLGELWYNLSEEELFGDARP
jgi:energy-coupling factor transporter ATP-binding protein EcfA2